MSSKDTDPRTPRLVARELQDLTDQRLGLVLLSGENGLHKEIGSRRIQKLGLALAGYVDYIHGGRIQFIGRSEMNYLATLSDAQRRKAIQRIFLRQICCIIVTTGLDPPAELVESCDQHAVPLFRTGRPSSEAITGITEFLEDRLAPATTIHGVLMEVFGLGVLLLGPSGIGKSECALDLILRGHRLVSDDLILIKKFGTDRLVGAGPPDFQYHMELRGLGIINIKELFGISVLNPRKQIDLAIDLVRWKAEEEYDRLGIDEQRYTLLDVPVPLITMPVASGRNLATLVEVAVRIQMLKSQGYSPSSDFFKRLEARLKAPHPPIDEAWRL